MEISVPVETNNIGWIDTTNIAKIKSSESPQEWNGNITRIGDNVDMNTQTVNIYIKIDNQNSNQLLNNIFVGVDSLMVRITGFHEFCIQINIEATS